MGSKEKAQEGSDEFRFRAGQSSYDHQRAAGTSHSTFESTNESRLGSGQSNMSEPAQASGGSLDLITMTVCAVTAMLGAAAVAKALGRKS